MTQTEHEGKKNYLRLVPAVDQSIRILYSLAAAPEATASLTELCREVGISKSKGLALLNTLQGGAFVVRNEQSKLYTPGPGLLVLSRALLDNTDLATDAAPYLVELAQVTGATSFLGAIVGGQYFVVARRRPPAGQLAQIAVEVGEEFPLYYGAHGKAILAVLAVEERERILREEELHFQDATQQDVDLNGLRAELEECARLGYARDLGGMNPGVNVLGAPLLDHRSTPVACLQVTGTFPASKAAEFGGYLVEAVRAMRLGPPFHTRGRS